MSCLQWTPHIHMLVDWMKMFGSGIWVPDGDSRPQLGRLTQTGKLFLQVLRGINDLSTPAGKRRRLSMRSYGISLTWLVKTSGLWAGADKRSILLKDPELSTAYWGVTETIGLLRSIKRDLHVSVRDTEWTVSDGICQPLTRELDLEAFPWNKI